MLVITAAVFLLFSASRASLDDDLLLVNGEVTTSSIRILLEDTAATDNRSLHYTVCRQVRHHPERPMLSEGSHVFQLQVNRPSVLQLPKLTACSDYHVRFSYSNQSLHCGQTIPEIDVTNVVQSSFRTICDETEDFRFVVLSCDRFADDWTTGNDEFVQNYVAKIKDFDVAFHMGDQIYADQLLNLDYSNVEQLVEAYRHLYRIGWVRPGFRTFLRQGSHIMVPDDHDFQNAFSPEMFNDPSMTDIVIAGKRTIFEYQRSLVDASEKENVTNYKVSWSGTFGSTAVFALDTRFHHAFFDPKEPYSLLGEAQTRQAINQMQNWRGDAKIKRILILSGLPLLWPSTFHAHVARLVEGDEYPIHPNVLENTGVILDEAYKLNTKKPVILIGGDIHMYNHVELCQYKRGIKQSPCLHSYASSGITHSSCALSQAKLALFFTTLYWFFPPTVDIGHVRWTSHFHDMDLRNNIIVLDALAEQEQFQIQPILMKRGISESIRNFFLFQYGGPIFLVMVVVFLSVLTAKISTKLQRHRIKQD